MSKFKLGIEVKDIVTGFKGITMARAEYLTGCDQYLVLPQPKGNKTYPESQWIDDGRLKATKKGMIIKPDDIADPENPGCDLPLPSKK
jgi:hypothetical protein